MGRIVGIDLGTTNSVVAVVEPLKDSIKILHNKEGEHKTRSIVGYWRNDTLIGSPALRILGMDPQNVIISVKRLMGRSISDTEVDIIKKSALYKIVEPTDGTKDSVCVVLGGKEYYPEDVSAMILKKLKADAEYVLGEEVTHAVITVPAYFSEKQRHATREAGLKAGLNVMNILDEPTAAAIAFGIEEEGKDKTAKAIVVYDLGGGTFDVSVLMMAGGSFAPLDLEGDMWLGGDNFDQAIVDYATEIIKKEHGVDPTNNIKFMAELKIEAQKAKETLSSANRTFIMGILNDNSGRQIPYEIEVTKEQFEKMIEPLVDKTINLVKLALENSHLTSDDIDYVLMAGNSSSVPFIQEKVGKLFGKEKVSRKVHPKECVAKGAAVLAAKGLIHCPECQHENNLDAKECEKCGVPLKPGGGGGGVDVIRIAAFNYGIQTADDKFKVFIKKGDSYPTPDERIIPQTFYTRSSGQRIISIPVYGGDVLECASKNEKQGIACAFLPPNCFEGTAVTIKLWLNSDGNFELSAKLDDNTNLKPWTLRGKGDQKLEEKIVDLEIMFNNEKHFVTADKIKEFEKRLEEILLEAQKNNTQLALEKAEKLHDEWKGGEVLPGGSGTDPYILAKNMISFAKYVVNEYGWLIDSHAYRLNELGGQLEYSISKNDSLQMELKLKELEDEINKLFNSNPIGVLFGIRMTVISQLEPSDPLLANKFITELHEIEMELKFAIEARREDKVNDVMNKLMNFSKRLEAAIKATAPKGIKCAMCGYQNPPGVRYCQGRDCNCGIDLWLISGEQIAISSK